MEKVNPKRAMILGVLLAIYGFYNVTQAGQPAPVFQNDGLAMTGGIALVLAGVLIGVALAVRKLGTKGARGGKR